jgi:hypothetical protein
MQEVHFSASDAPQYSQKALSAELSAPHEEHDFMAKSDIVTGLERGAGSALGAAAGSALGAGAGFRAAAFWDAVLGFLRPANTSKAITATTASTIGTRHPHDMITSSEIPNDPISDICYLLFCPARMPDTDAPIDCPTP